MGDIEDKLHKSLDDLIKEASQKRQDNGSSGPRKGRVSASASGKRLRKSKDAVDSMDIDNEVGAKVSLGPRGRIGKKRQSGGSTQPKAAPKVLSISMPKGNIHAKWKHDLHEDDGPPQPRKLSGYRPSHRPDVLRVIELDHVPMSVTMEDIQDLCETVVRPEDVLNVHRQPTGHSQRMTVEFRTEVAASSFLKKYQDVKLDEVQLKVTQRGCAIPSVLKSGVTVTTKQQSTRRPVSNGGAPRGRGASGRMRSDRMDE